MSRILLFVLTAIALPAAALDVDVVRSITAMPNPSHHNPDYGAAQTTRAGTTTYYTTTGDKQVYIGAGTVESLINASGTSVTVSFWDDADGTCNGGQKTGVIPLTNGTPLYPGWEFFTGICMAIAGTSPTVTIVTLP